MRHELIGAILFCSALALGCEGLIGGGDQPGSSGVETTPGGDVLPVDHPVLDPPIVSAAARRISIEHLRRSLPVVLGNDKNGEPITWKVGSQKGLDVNGDTLGEADYLNTTEDNMEPAPLYLKFMDDVARDVCTKALDADAERTDAASRVILRHVEPTDSVQSKPAAIDQNLRYLKLRFHGDVKAEIAPLRTLFDQAVTQAAAGDTPTASHVKTGWHVVCVALVTAPEFHIY